MKPIRLLTLLAVVLFALAGPATVVSSGQAAGGDQPSFAKPDPTTPDDPGFGTNS